MCVYVHVDSVAYMHIRLCAYMHATKDEVMQGEKLIQMLFNSVKDVV